MAIQGREKPGERTSRRGFLKEPLHPFNEVSDSLLQFLKLTHQHHGRLPIESECPDQPRSLRSRQKGLRLIARWAPQDRKRRMCQSGGS